MKNSLLVVGMHRSGTSALAGALSLLGVELGSDLLPPRSGENESGFFESKEILAFHEELLHAGGRTWDTPSTLAADWLDRHAGSSAQKRLAEILKRKFAGTDLWAVKDPRLSRLLPLWIEVLAELDVEVAVVHIVRSPAAVAASLARRDGFSAPKSGFLWIDHVLSAELASRGQPRVFLSYEQLLEKKMESLQWLADQLKLSWPRSGESVADEVERYLSRDLDHAGAASAGEGPDFGWWSSIVDDLHRLLRQLSAAGSRRREEQTFNRLRKQRDSLLSKSDPLLLDHSADLVLAPGGLRDLRQEAEAKAAALASSEKYARQVESDLESARRQDGKYREHLSVVEADLAASQAMVEQVGTYAGGLERDLQHKVALIGQLEDEIGALTSRIADHERALETAAEYARQVERDVRMLQARDKESVEYTADLERQIEEHRARHEESADFVRALEQEIENHREAQRKVADYASALEQEIENHRRVQRESAEYVRDLEREIEAHKAYQERLARHPHRRPAGGGKIDDSLKQSPDPLNINRGRQRPFRRDDRVSSNRDSEE